MALLQCSWCADQRSGQCAVTEAIERLLWAGAAGIGLINTMAGDGRRRVLAHGSKAQAGAKE